MTQADAPVAGWYPDPYGSGALRWWDGARWGDQLTPAATPYAAPRRRPVPAGTPIYTPWIWLVAAMPVLSGLLLWLLHPQALFHSVPGSTRVTVPDPFALLGGPMYFVVIGLNWLLAAVLVVASWLDYRELVRRGVERPFHWAWSFLSVVYPIGRSVVVRGVAGGRGLAPIWVTIAAYVVGLALSLIWVIRLVAEILGSAPLSVPLGA